MNFQIISPLIGKKIRTYQKNRTCKFPHCETVLNQYNPDRLCGIHRRLVIQYQIKSLYRFINYQIEGVYGDD